MADAVVSIPFMPEPFAAPTPKQATMQKNLVRKAAAKVGCPALPHIRSRTEWHARHPARLRHRR